MKILQVNCVYNTGSTGKIVQDIHTELEKMGIESFVCYGRGVSIAKPNIVKVCGEVEAKWNHFCSLVSGLEYAGCERATKRLIKQIETINPDVVHLHCINGYFVNIYKLFDYLKKNRIPTVLTQHAEFMYTGGCGYTCDCNKYLTGCGTCPQFKSEKKSLFLDCSAKAWKLMKKSFEGFENIIVTSVSPFVTNKAKKSPIMKEKRHITVLNGVDTEVFRAHLDVDKLKQKLGIKEEKIVLYVTSDFHSEIKGGKYFVEIAEYLQNYNYKFLLIGSSGKEQLPKNVINLGKVYNQKELSRYYSLADVTIITSKRETFSMPVAESLCCGTPVVGFKAGGPEMIAIPEYSEFVEQGQVKELIGIIQKWTSKLVDKNEISKNGISVYSKQSMVDAYVFTYKEVLQRG